MNESTMPTCRCGAKMYQHIMFSGIGSVKLNRYSCPLNRWWNFWKHPDTSQSLRRLVEPNKGTP